ncbi:MAG: sugar transferase [Akkermansia sp.]|nr:sugar transferase [Akkermansia sp.]MBR2314906.1 sugar transferase [Akkermansia sp.]
MTRSSKFYLQSFYPLLDMLLAGTFAYLSPMVVNLLAPLLGWQMGDFFNLLTATPFLAGAAIVSVPVILRQVGFYHKQNMQRVSTALRQLVAFETYYLCALGVYMALTNHTDFFNQTVLINFIGIPLTLFLRFLVTKYLLMHRADQSAARRQVILTGTKKAMDKGWGALPEHWRRNFNVVAQVESSAYNEAEVQKIIESSSVNGLFVFGGLSAHHDNEAIVTQCEVQGIDVNLVLRDRVASNLRVELNEVGETRMVVLSSTPVHSWQRFFKGLLDRLTALLILICSSPLWLVAAIGIKLSDPKGPVFFRQRRSGLYGREFRMWKFRSMYVDAEARLEEVKARYGNEMNGPIFKLTNDPRIFGFGHFIRKTSIDELPQLLNILCGDMSIVGPRPLPVYETEAFPKIEHRRRLSVKPGLTCFWQIEDRSDNGDFDNMVAKDLRYIDEWSLWLDIKLFFRTIPAVLFGKGAK